MVAADGALTNGIADASVRDVRSQAGGIALVLAGIAWAVWFFLESAAPRLGFDDTDNPAVSLEFLRAHSIVYAQMGVALMVLSMSLVGAVLAVGDRIGARGTPLTSRSTTVFGLFSAAFFLGHAALRLSAGPILHIDSLNSNWGEAAYITIQMVGIHLMAQVGLLAFSLWALGVAIVGWRSRAIPRWLSALAIVPALRLATLLGPLGFDGPDVVWLAFMISIAGTVVWLVLFGLVLLRRPGAADGTGGIHA
jgi:hypothetical protein